jgi:hypothetical protein
MQTPKSRPDLTPTEIIRLGIQSGQPADVIIASLEAAGWVCVPVEPKAEMLRAATLAEHEHFYAGKSMTSHTWNSLSCMFVAKLYRAMLSARPK